MPQTFRPTGRVDDSKFDERVPDEASDTAAEIGLAAHSAADKLEYAVHRTGLTPRLKILMAALRHMTDFGAIQFPVTRQTYARRNFIEFVTTPGGLYSYPTADDPEYRLPAPPMLRPRY